jgi:RNA-directed DNA polymerase
MRLSWTSTLAFARASLEKFFDRVNHDILMARLARRIGDKRLLRIIRQFLQAGMMADGVCSERREGTPQGGPLTP